MSVVPYSLTHASSIIALASPLAPIATRHTYVALCILLTTACLPWGKATSCEQNEWFSDQDGDGFGDAQDPEEACEQPGGYVADGTDCDDEDSSVRPDAAEEAYNGIDDDCNPSTPDDDLDDDGFGSIAAGGDDCDDDDPTTYPGAIESCADGAVNNCDDDEATAMSQCGFGGTLSLSSADLILFGEASGDGSGIAVAGAGDVDGDALADILVGASGEDTGATSAGAAYLLLGGGALAGADITSLDLAGADIKLTGEASEVQAGRAVASAGDVDGDGLDDVLIGAPYDDSHDTDAGATYLLFGGGALSAATRTFALSEADIGFVGEAADDYAGRSISSAGDVDGDGLDDIILGASGDDTSGVSAGAAYLLLSVGAIADGTIPLNLGYADTKLTGESGSDDAGSSVSSAGDVDGDGLGDVLVGANNAWIDTRGQGAAYLLLGGSVLWEGPPQLALTDADLVLKGEAADDQAGTSVANAGDIDADGLDDILVGAWYEATGASSAGAAYVLLGGGALRKDSSQLDLIDADMKVVGEAEQDYAGVSVSNAGDVDGDNRDDILVGAYYEDTGGSDAGAAYVFLGGGTLSAGPYLIDASSADAKLTGEATSDHAGYRAKCAGDTNGDGFDDVLVGAAGNDRGGLSAGATYLMLGGGY